MKYPFLTDGLHIALNKSERLLISINMFTQKLRILKRDMNNENEDEIAFHNASTLVWTGDGLMEEISYMKDVTQYIARTNNMLVAAGREALISPSISLCNTPKTQQILVIDLSPKGKKKSRDPWDEEQKGWHYNCDDDGDINLRRVHTSNLKIKPWPFKNIYIGDDNDSLGLPAMFFYPLLKRFMDDQLSDPYFFKDREKVILNLPDLYTVEERVTTAGKRGRWGNSISVKWNDYQAEYDKAKEVLKRL